MSLKYPLLRTRELLVTSSPIYFDPSFSTTAMDEFQLPATSSSLISSNSPGEVDVVPTMDPVDSPSPAAASSRLSHDEADLHVSLNDCPLDSSQVLQHLRSPVAGANLLFLGTTRSDPHPTSSRPVTHLFYSAYKPLALKTMLSIAREIKHRWELVKIAMVHRLGNVRVGEESIIVGVAAGHRSEAWKAGEEALEECKRRVEIWKKEIYEGGDGEWRANTVGGVGAGEGITSGKGEESA